MITVWIRKVAVLIPLYTIRLYWIDVYLEIDSQASRMFGLRNQKDKKGENTVMEDVEYDVDEITDSDFSKATARVFDKIDNGKDGVLPSSKFVDLIKPLGEGYIGLMST